MALNKKAIPITINGNTVDPTSPDAPPEFSSLDASQTNYILIQSDSRLNREQQEELKRLHVKIQTIVSRNTYLCRYEPADLGAIQAKPFVLHTSIYHPCFVVEDELRKLVGIGISDHEQSQLDSEDDSDQELGEDGKNYVGVEAFLHNDLDTPAAHLVQQLEAKGLVQPGSCVIGGQIVHMRARKDRLAEIASLESVRSLGAKSEISFENDAARRILNAERTYYSAGGHGIGFRGNDEIITITDSGFLPLNYKPTDVHPSFKDKIKSIIRIKSSKGQSDGTDSSGHGTHVAGSALGLPVSCLWPNNATTVMDGVATQAKLIAQCLRGKDKNGKEKRLLPDDRQDLFEQPISKGSWINSNSWNKKWKSGETEQRPYADNDAGMADLACWRNPELVVLFSAGNNGEEKATSPGQIQAWASAKNVITVGNCFSDRPCDGDEFDNINGKATNPNNVDPSSSRGPTKEERQKPDVVAPGTVILSSQVLGSTAPETFGVSPQPNRFCFKAGTSMAAAFVAGCCACIREALKRSGRMAKPSSMLIKALLIHGAKSLKGGVYDGTTRIGDAPDPIQGYGRVDLQKSIDLIVPHSLSPPSKLYDSTASNDPLTALDHFNEAIKIPADYLTLGWTTLKMTLVWNDSPGTELVNHLRFSVMDGWEERRATKGNTNMEGRNGDDDWDQINNVQQIVWKGFQPETLKYTIDATRITADFVHYAYVWSLEA